MISDGLCPTFQWHRKSVFTVAKWDEIDSNWGFSLMPLQFRNYFAPVWCPIWLCATLSKNWLGNLILIMICDLKKIRGPIGIAIIDFSDDDNFSINIGSEYFLVNNLHRELGKLELGRQTRQWPLLWPVISRFIFLFSSAQLDEILSILKKHSYYYPSILHKAFILQNTKKYFMKTHINQKKNANLEIILTQLSSDSKYRFALRARRAYPLPNYVVCTRLANFPLILQLFLNENMSVGRTYILESFQN